MLKNMFNFGIIKKLIKYGEVGEQDEGFPDNWIKPYESCQMLLKIDRWYVNSWVSLMGILKIISILHLPRALLRG